MSSSSPSSADAPLVAGNATTDANAEQCAASQPFIEQEPFDQSAPVADRSSTSHCGDAPASDDTSEGAARTLQRGKGLLKADVVLTCHDGQPVIRKDYTRYADSWLALPARLLVRRERRLLERLHDWPHAPRVVAQLGKLSLLIEYVPGELLSEVDPGTPASFVQLMTALTSLHRASVVHNDVRGSNVILSRGRVVLIDFASALYLPGGRALRFLLKPLRRSDLASGLKLKARLSGEPLTAEENALRQKPRWQRAIQRGWKQQWLPRLKRRFGERRTTMAGDDAAD
ncbi:RIO1 family regulatory kinase/ATPase [Salinicola halophilus]|uniref:RIO1 family regulatory kinase/ATPase domain-containing protein n=1 Tax=Salinicola halophilus TaxID=184065 RepID=UPI000DA1553E|nr:RIO1 family regulatory kinase/ATPase [Salinicola halophilus]